VFRYDQKMWRLEIAAAAARAWAWVSLFRHIGDERLGGGIIAAMEAAFSRRAAHDLSGSMMPL